EIATYNRTLPATEIRAHYQAGTAAAQMTKATMPSGRVWAQNSYVADGGRLQTHTDLNGGLWKLSALQYSAGPQATVVVTDPHNGTLTSVHDALRVLRTTSKTDQLGKKTTYEYDTGGYVGKITDRNGNTTQLTHDERGNELSMTKCRAPGDCQTTYASYYLNTADLFDPRNDQVTAYRDARSPGSGSNTYATKWEYTTFGDKAKETTPATLDFPNGRSTTYTYTDGSEAAVGGGTTPAGLLKAEADPKGNQRTYAYTAAGDVAQVTEPTGLVTAYTYDAIGRKTSTSRISGGGQAPAPLATQDGPVAAYGFNVGSGTAVADDSGHSQAGTATDTTWATSGKFGKALSFNGTSSLVTIPDSPSLRLSDGMTLMAWVNPTVLDNWRQAILKEFSGGLSYALYASNGTQPNGWAVNTDGTEGSVDSTEDIPLNTWSHLALTYDGSKLAFYLNGAKTAETDFQGTLRGDDGPLRIGGNGIWGEHFAGLIDEVRVYDRALSEAEIQSDKDTPVTPSDPETPGGATSTSTFTYDAYGRLAKQTASGVKNQISGVTHTAETGYTYDADGNKLAETLADLTGGDPSRTTTYEYDTYGRVQKVTGPEGGVQRTSYDHRGRVVNTVDAAGATYDYGYTARGESATVTLKGWTGSPIGPQPAQDVVVHSYAYDPGGRLASETDALGRTTRYTYFGDDTLAEKIASQARLNASTTPVDVVLSSATYDAAGNLTREVAGGGKTRVDYVWDASGRMTSSTLDPAGLGRKTAYAYDANTNVTQKTLTATGTPRTETESYRYDAGDRMIEQTVKNGSADLMTTWKLDDRGLVTEVTDPRGNAAGANRMDYTSLIDYDAFGRVVKVQEPPVAVERGGSAPVTERPTSKVGYNTAGEQTHETGPEGRAGVMVHDKAGRITSITGTPYTPPGGTAVTPRTLYEYDAAGRMTAITDPRGNVANITYDVLGRTVRITDPPATTGAPRGNWDYTYTLTGERLSSTDPTGARIEGTYDGLARQVTTTQLERKPTAVALTTMAEYDTAGNPVAVVQPAGNRTQATVNAAGEIITQADGLNHSSTFEYDLAGRTTKVTDALGNATVAEYDLAGRKTAAKDLNASGTVLRTYGFESDAAGNLVGQTSPEGHLTRRTYDAADRLTQLVEPVSATKSITTSFGYNAAGERTRTTDGRGNATLATYNTLGRVETRVEPATQAHPNLSDRTWTFVYDASGNQVSVLQPGNVRVTNTYDNLDRLTNEAGTGAEAATQANTFGYDLAGRRTSAGDLTFDFNDRGLLLTTVKAGTPAALSSFGYDANDRLTQRTDAAGSATFTWDAADRLKTYTDPVTSTTLTYGYDDADRLTGIDYGTSGPKRTYAYDPMDRLTGDTLKTSAGAAIASITYGYDRDDNLTTKTTAGTAGAGTNTYTYDWSNRLTSWTAPGGAVTDYTWDDSGNRTKAGAKTFTYDERNRLLSGDGTTYTYTARGTTASETKGNVTKILQFDALDRMTSDGEAVYTYDALDRVTSRTQGAAVSRYVYGDLANDIVAMTDAAGVKQASYSRGVGGEPIGISDGTGPRFAFTDQHGDVIGTFTSTATSLADSVAYNPFGEETARNGARHDLGYQGELTDPATGKVNMHARWYQPGTGTFTSRDTWTLGSVPSARHNRYAYGNANPLIHVDPSGHEWIKTQTCFWAGRLICFPGLVWREPRRKTAPPPQDYCNGGNKNCNAQPKSKDYCNLGNKDCDAPQPPRDKSPSNDRLEQTTVTTPTPCRYSCGGPTNQPNRPTPKPEIDCSHGPNMGYCDKLPPEAKTGCKTCYIYGYNPDLDVLDCNFASPDAECPPPNPDLISCMGRCAPSGDCGNTGGMQLWGPSGGCPPPGGGAPSPIEQFAQDCSNNIICDFTIGDAVNCIANPNLIDCAVAAAGVIPVGKLAGGAIKLGRKLPKILKPAERCLGRNSFVVGTLVLMADGTRKRIEEVQVGDWVLATDPETGQTGPRLVLDLITGDGDKSLVEITADADGPKGDATGVVIATEGHPFWVPKLHTWLTAAELRVGTLLQTSAGTRVQITAIKKWTAAEHVHNLTIAGLHTYYVMQGGRAVLVHNAPKPRDASGRFTSGAGGESADTANGRRVHENYRNALGDGYDYDKRLPSGQRPDAVDWKNRVVRELKSDAAGNGAKGKRQLNRYIDELEKMTGDSWTGYLDRYKRC
ncbi:LamG-like jellyroll fold domain-containing protein, partial [Sphaerisporangium sp. NPDC051017]|uniref:LamG-like jellyroll fold domain-containing protein n=1 Tax=Sphaerisporangium sp. NPDC051017 TaxID=3154636 RepID=UPI003415B746